MGDRPNFIKEKDGIMKKELSKTAEIILCSLTVIAAVAFVFFRTPTAVAANSATTVRDVSSSEKKIEIAELLSDGVLPVYESSGEYFFLPYDASERAYTAYAVVKAAGIEPKDYEAQPLDVADEARIPAEYLPYVKAAVLSGIMPIYGVDGKYYFYPERDVSRDEAAYILSKLATGASSSSKIDTFSDKGDIAEAFYAGVDKAISLGIAEGYPDGTFRPTSAITHEELAAWLYNLKHLS